MTESTDALKSAPAKKNNAKFYVGLVFVSIILCCYPQILPIFRNVLQEHFKISLVQFGFLLSVGLLPSAISNIIVGILIPKWGSRRVLRICILGFAFGSLIASTGRVWGLMVVAVAVMTTFYNGVYVTGQTYLTAMFPDRRRQILSIYYAMTSVGGVIFPLLAEFLLWSARTFKELTFEYILHFPFGIVMVAMIALSFAFHKKSPDPKNRNSLEAQSWWKNFQISKDSMVLLIAWAFLSVADTVIVIWMPRVLISFQTIPVWIQPGYVISAYNLAYIVSRVLLSLVPEKRGQQLLSIMPGMAGGIIFLLGLFSQNVVLISFSYVLGGLIWSLQVPSILSIISKQEGDRFGVAISLGMLSISAIAFALSNILGAIGEQLGESRLWMILVIPAFGYPLATVTAWLHLRRRKDDGR